jgi:hypothetical protein
MGKGSSPRPIADPDSFRENHDRIFRTRIEDCPLGLIDIMAGRPEHIREIIDRIRGNIADQGLRKEREDSTV